MSKGVTGTGSDRLSVPIRSTLGAWLCREPIGSERGDILSWVNSPHPGYPYPEAGALWIMWAIWRADRGEDGPSKDAVRSVVDGLERTLAAGHGVGRDGATYLFDTILALGALARWTQHSPDQSPPKQVINKSVAVLTGFVASMPVQPGDIRPDSWSSTWGGHLRRAIGFLREAALVFGDSRLVALADSIDITVSSRSLPSRYSHAIAYQAEGWIMQGHLDRASSMVDSLESIQRPDGSVPAWGDGTGPRRLDVTAQLVRLQARLDRRRPSMNRALDFLRRCQDASGGLPYEPGSRDLNTWVGVFTDQAVAWALDGYDGSWI